VSNSIDVLIAAVSAGAGVVSALVSIVAARDSRRSSNDSENAKSEAGNFAKDADRAAVEANRHAERANIIHARAWADQYFESVRTWADDAASIIALAIHINDAPDAPAGFELLKLRARLSAAIDRGRWYFPNRGHDEIGQHKEPAFRGIRQPVIDYLCNAYAALSSTKLPTPDRRATLVKAQRAFVSEVQRVLDPRARDIEIATVLENFRVAELLRNESGTVAVAKSETADLAAATAE